MRGSVRWMTAYRMCTHTQVARQRDKVLPLVDRHIGSVHYDAATTAESRLSRRQALLLVALPAVSNGVLVATHDTGHNLIVRSFNHSQMLILSDPYEHTPNHQQGSVPQTDACRLYLPNRRLRDGNGCLNACIGGGAARRSCDSRHRLTCQEKEKALLNSEKIIFNIGRRP
jgi:hypothetical protein